MKIRIIFLLFTSIYPASAASIWPVGDSLTSGFSVAGAYRPQLCGNLTGNGLAVNFVGSLTNDSTTLLRTAGEANHDGHTSWFIADSLTGSVDNNKGIYDNIQGWYAGISPPDVILLMIGTNDLNQGNLVSTAAERFGLLLTRLEALSPAARIIIGSVPKASETNIYKNTSVTALNTSIDTYNGSILGIVNSHLGNGKNVQFLDVNAAMSPADLGSDGLHFSQSGYDKLGNLWAGAVLVPEPGTVVLAAAGGLMLVSRRRRVECR